MQYLKVICLTRTLTRAIGGLLLTAYYISMSRAIFKRVCVLMLLCVDAGSRIYRVCCMWN